MTSLEPPAESSTAARWGRVVLAGPWTFVAAAVFMAAMAVWVPAGIGRVNNIIMPLTAFPVVWLVLFLCAYLDRNLLRATVVSVSITAINTALIVWHVSNSAAG